MREIGWITCVVLLGTCACGSDVSTKSVKGKTSILLGASTTTSLMSLGEPQAGIRPMASNGNYLLSPSKAKITFTKVAFVQADGSSNSATLSGCQVTYDRSQAGGAELLNCDFNLSIPESGASYVGIYIYFSPTVSVLINDTTNGIYSSKSSSTSLTLTAPTGGAEYVDYTVTSSGGDLSAQTYFASALKITQDSSPSIKVITDMIHTIYATVSGSTASFNTNQGQRPVELLAITSGSGRSELYSEASTTDGVSSTTAFARIFFADNTPLSVVTSGVLSSCKNGTGPSGAYAANPINSPTQSTAGYKAGGYLGLDSSNSKISWAMATDWLWTTYVGLFQITRQTTLSASVNLECKATTTVSAPTSGDTYTTAPTLSSPVQIAMKLLAK